MLSTASVTTKSSHTSHVIPGFSNFRCYLVNVAHWTGQALDHFGAPQIVEVNDPFQVVTLVHNGQRSNFALFHYRECGGGEFLARNGLGVASHALAGREV